MNILHLGDGPPDFINEEGVKWWKDAASTLYAQTQDRFGTSLDMVCFWVEFPNGDKSRVLVSKKTRQVVEEDHTLEGMGCKIDVRKMLLRDLAQKDAEKVDKKTTRKTRQTAR